MERKRKKSARIASLLCAVMLLWQSAVMDAQALTFYESDEQYHAEGYIFVGESHIANMTSTMIEKKDAAGNIPGAEHIQYELQWDGSREVTEKGYPNTFVMKGNLFFVFEGISGKDASVQTGINYLHSDGKGGYGRAVERIHEIIDGNPNIAHWNIISFTGGVVAKNGASGARTHVEDYRNWIDYEFPYANVYIISQSTMTKYYRSMKDPEAYNRTLAAAFPDEFLDYTEFFKARYPQGMLDPALVQDTVHWSHDTYFELFLDVIHEVDRRRQDALQESIEQQPDVQQPVYETVDVDMVMYTNTSTQLYREPFLGSEIVVPVCEQGNAIQVNGITTTGFYRVILAEETYYIPEMGLSAENM